MEEKNQMIINYINNIRTQFANNNIPISDESVNKVTAQFLNSSKSFEEIQKEIDELVKQKLQELQKRQEFAEKMKNKSYYADAEKDDRESRTFSQIKYTQEKVNDLLESAGLKVYISGGSVPYLLLNQDSNRLHDDIDTICRIEDMSNLRRLFQEVGLYNPEWDSMTYSADGRDYGFEMKINGVPYGIYPFQYENGILTQYTYDPYLKRCKIKEFPLSEISDYISTYRGLDGKTYDTMSLEYIKKSKDIASRPKDIIDSNKILETGLVRQEVYDRIAMYQQVQDELASDLGKKYKRNYNYHTHTYRSGHGEYCSDEELLLSAKNSGITTLGFSEHIPNPDLILPDEDHRMMLSEVDGYLASIEEMKQKHSEMTILAGFEAEYDPMKEAFLGEMREKVDYMILGQHFVPNGMAMAKQDGNPNYPIEYANMLCKAIESGLFDIVAHPDIFMQFRDSMQSEEDKKLFDENSVLASQIICEKARDMGIPIEINLSSAENNKSLSDGSLAYPHPTFWQMAKEIEGLQVLMGIDAHHQEAFAKANESEKLVANITNMVSDKMISSEYNPVVARSNNQKLQDAYKKGQDSALSFETHLVSQMATAVAQRLPNEIVSDDLAMGICTGFDSVIESSLSNANEKDKKIVEEISAISEASDLSIQDKKGKLSRKKIAMEETNQVISNQQRAIQTAKQSVVSSVTMGCETKPEVINITTQITEHNTTKNEEHKSKIETNVASFQESKGTQVTQEKGTPLVKKPNNNGNNSNGNGFVNVVTLSLLVTFVLGVAVGIGYMIYRFMLRG